MALFTDIHQFAANLVGMISKAGAIWFCAWAIRRKGEFDYPLDFAAQVIRWSAVVILLGVAANFPALPMNLYRLLVFSGIGFLAWPNFAYHLARLLRWCKILPASKTSDEPQAPPDEAHT